MKLGKSLFRQVYAVFTGMKSSNEILLKLLLVYWAKWNILHIFMLSLYVMYKISHVFSLQILNLFFSISFSLPKPINSSLGIDIELSYIALSSLEDVVAILRSVSSTIFSLNYWYEVIKWGRKYVIIWFCNILILLLVYSK